MAEYTQNYNLEKQQGNDNVNINGINNNFDIIDAEIKNAQDKAEQAFQSVSNGKSLVAGAITDKGVLTSPTDTFQQMADNIGAIETDPSIGTTDAMVSDILAGKKVVSQGNLITGTMPNRGAVNQNLTVEGQEYTIPSGYHNGLGKIKAVITGLAASAIKTGTTVGGIVGTYTSDATATATQILAGAIAYVNGNKVTGTIPSKGAATITPGTLNQTIAANQYLSGVQTVAGSANLLPENIKKDVNIFGKVGTLSEAIIETTITHGLSYYTNTLNISNFNPASLIRSGTVYTVPTGLLSGVVYFRGAMYGKSTTAKLTLRITTNNPVYFNFNLYRTLVYKSGGSSTGGSPYTGTNPLLINGTTDIVLDIYGNSLSTTDYYILDADYYSRIYVYNPNNATITINVMNCISYANDTFPNPNLFANIYFKI